LAKPPFRRRLARGRVDMQLSWENLEEKPMTLRLDKAVVAGVRDVLEQLRLAGSTPESLKLEHFLHFSDLLVAKEQANQDLELEATWETVSQALNQALDLLDEMRLTEGAALAADLLQVLEERAHRRVELIRLKIKVQGGFHFPGGVAAGAGAGLGQDGRDAQRREEYFVSRAVFGQLGIKVESELVVRVDETRIHTAEERNAVDHGVPIGGGQPRGQEEAEQDDENHALAVPTGLHAARLSFAAGESVRERNSLQGQD